MAYEQKQNSGSLFPNKRKEKESHPDLTGTLDVDGVQYWINAWSKTAKTNGEEWLSISIRPKDAQSQPAKTYTAPTVGKWARPVAPAPLNPSEDNEDKPTDSAADSSIPF
jgi:hypothetical protein